MAPITLTQEEVDNFNKFGFIVVPNLLEESDMAVIEREFVQAFDAVRTVASDSAYADKIHAAVSRNDPHIIVFSAAGSRYTYQKRGAWSDTTQPSMDTLSVRHVAWCGKDFPVLLEQGRHPRILSVAAQLLGLDPANATMTQMINQAHFKEPKDGVAFAWHQDSHHRRMAHGDFVDVNGRGSYVQVIVAVEDTHADAGPVMFIPGSGKNGHIDGTAGLDPKTVEGSTAVTSLLRRGDAVCLSPYVIHGSEPNNSSSWRRTFVNGFAYPGAQLAPDKVYFEHINIDPSLLPTPEERAAAAAVAGAAP